MESMYVARLRSSTEVADFCRKPDYQGPRGPLGKRGVIPSRWVLVDVVDPQCLHSGLNLMRCFLSSCFCSYSFPSSSFFFCFFSSLCSASSFPASFCSLFRTCRIRRNPSRDRNGSSHDLSHATVLTPKGRPSSTCLEMNHESLGWPGMRNAY